MVYSDPEEISPGCARSFVSWIWAMMLSPAFTLKIPSHPCSLNHSNIIGEVLYLFLIKFPCSARSFTSPYVGYPGSHLLRLRSQLRSLTSFMQIKIIYTVGARTSIYLDLWKYQNQNQNGHCDWNHHLIGGEPDGSASSNQRTEKDFGVQSCRFFVCVSNDIYSIS